MGGPDIPSTTTQISKVELPAWVEQASQENYDFAKQVANKPLQQYQGDTVAGPSQTTLDSYDFFKNTMGTGTSQYNAAAQGLQGVLGSNPSQVVANMLPDMDRSAYMNPYVQEVVNKSMAALGDARDQALMANADKAVAAKAFGGSRAAVVDAITNSETAKQAGLLSSQLYSDAFNQATAAMQGDATRGLQADLANQQAGLQKAATDVSAAQGLLGAGNALNQSRLTDFLGLQQIGQQQQAQSQAEIDADLAKFLEARDYDLERLNTRLAALGMSPYGRTETTTKNSTQGGSGPDWAQFGAGFLSFLPALMGLSDKTEKTDIKKVGKDPDTGIPLYSYRYKGDPKTYPKVVGPMAQDIEKKIPGAVANVGGKKVVHKGILASMTR